MRHGICKLLPISYFTDAIKQSPNPAQKEVSSSETRKGSTCQYPLQGDSRDLQHQQHNMGKLLSLFSCKLSILLLLFVGFLNVAAGFTTGSGICAGRRQLFASADKGDANRGSSAGAGSWRTKAKEFLNSKNGDDVDKKLNIAFVTGNAMKQREINTILSNHGATSIKDGESFVNLRILDVDLPEIQEINTEAVAKNKAIQGAQLAGGACVVEDTSLEFHALGGMPGPFIKWFQDKLGSDGLYKILIGYEDKAATAVCTLAFCPYPHADPVVFTGRCSGKIVEPKEGRGFGWDSIFVPDGETEPFSCMPTKKKCQLSHVSYNVVDRSCYYFFLPLLTFIFFQFLFLRFLFPLKRHQRSRAVVQWADWLGSNVDELWERQNGRPAIGHKGLDFKPNSSEQ